MYQNRVDGGDNGARTRDLLTASQALSQLSYTPDFLYIILQNCRIVKLYFKIFAGSQKIFYLFVYKINIKSIEIR